MTALGEPGRGVDAGADGRATERQLADPRQRRLEPLDAIPDGGGVAPELLPQRDRGRVHQVGAAALDDVGPLLGFARRARPRRWRSDGIRSLMIDRVAATWIAEGNTSLEDCDALTWSLGWTSRPSACEASVAMTSLAFMLLEVPEPVW